MPPKKGKQKEVKKKTSNVDKTFGMKNKKGSKAKKQIEQEDAVQPCYQAACCCQGC